MRLKDWLICSAVALCVAAYLVFMPPYIESGLKQDPYSEWVMPEDEGYTGIITVWHIVEFRPYAGSVGTWLSERGKELEKKHYGVYVEVLAMSAAECEARFARGESADMYSFPMGWGYAERFIPLEQGFSGLKEGLAETGMQEGTTYAVPFLMSGYTLLSNTRLLQEKKLMLPDSGINAAWLNEAATTLTYETGRSKKTKYQGLSGSAVAAALFGAAVPVADYSVFQAQRAGLAVAELRAAGDMTRLQGAGKGFAFEEAPLFNYTDLVQYLGVARGIDERKLPYAYGFLELALSQKAQKSLSPLGAFPVTEVPDLSYEIPIVAKVYALLKEPVVPNAFLYQRYKDALLEAASRTLLGEEAGKRELLARLKELVNGKEIK